MARDVFSVRLDESERLVIRQLADIFFAGSETNLIRSVVDELGARTGILTPDDIAELRREGQLHQNERRYFKPPSAGQPEKSVLVSSSKTD